MSETHILDELKWRGLVALSTDEVALRAALSAGPVTFYCGFDPTAPSLHMGNLVQLLTMRRLQRCRPQAARPRRRLHRADRRPQVDVRARPQRQGGGRGLGGEAPRAGEPFLSAEGDNAARVVNNLDWTAPLSAIDFLRDIGKHYRVNKMITKEAVAARLNSQEGISYTEFSYQMLQGLDFLELYRQYGCTLQTGGSDQWGNLTAGTDLIQHAERASVHLIATPLVTRADGTKYGKTEGGGRLARRRADVAVRLLPVLAQHRGRDGRSMLRIFSFRSHEEIEALERSARERPQLREAQRALASEVTVLVHGAESGRRVEEASQALFGRGELSALDADTLRDAAAELPSAVVSASTVRRCRRCWSCSPRPGSRPAGRRPAVRWPRAVPTSTTCGSPMRDTCRGTATCWRGAGCCCAGASATSPPSRSSRRPRRP